MQAPVVTYEAVGHTVMEALRKMTAEMPRRIYLAHLRIVVIGEDLAREGIGKSLDILSRFYEVRTDFFIVAARNRTAAEVLETLTALEKIPGNLMNTSLEMSEKAWSATSKTSLDDLISSIGNEGKRAVLTGIDIDGNPLSGQSLGNLQKSKPSAILRYSGMAVLQKDKLVGWLNEKESKGYNYTRGNLTDTAIEIPCPQGGYIGVELVRMKSSIHGKMKDSKPVGTVSVRAEGSLTEVECNMDVMKPGSIARMERDTESEIEEFIQEAVHKVQNDFHSDIFGFGEAIHRADSAAWKRLKRSWQQSFSEMDVNVNADVKIRRIGTVNEPVTKNVEE